MKNRNFLRVTAAALVLIMCVFAFTPPTNAAEPATEKEEVVYANLAGDGQLLEVNVVNILYPDENGHAVDYGSYESVRNMTTTDPISYSGGAVSVDTNADKLYYEGKMTDPSLPWNISIHYFLDGEETSAQSLAGRSGALRITMKITENPDCEGEFFDAFALQTSLTLDTGKCSNITAEGATIANAGRSKQLTYTILPGQGADIVVTADVTDFEMDGISINGVPLNLSLDLGDVAGELGGLGELESGIAELDDGAGSILDGVGALKSGAEQLSGGIGTFASGAAELSGAAEQVTAGSTAFRSGGEQLVSGAEQLDLGIKQLNMGAGEIQMALNALDTQSDTLKGGSAAFLAGLRQLQTALDGVVVTSQDLSALAAASGEIKSAAEQLASGAAALREALSFEAYKAAMKQNGLDVDSLKQQNAAAVGQLTSSVAELKTQAETMKRAGADTSSLEAQIAQFEGLIALIGANGGAIDGAEAYLNTLGENAEALETGAKQLAENYAAFDTQIAGLVDLLGNLAVNMAPLADAVTTLVTEYTTLDMGVAGYTDGLKQIAAGYAQVIDGASKLAEASGALHTGAAALVENAGALFRGVDAVGAGAKELGGGASKLSGGARDLLSGTVALYDGVSELKDGTAALREATTGIDSTIDEKIDSLLESFTGGDAETGSFVSDENTNVESVQFVIKTEPITVEAEDSAPVQETEQLNFWQRLLRLFGWY